MHLNKPSSVHSPPHPDTLPLNLPHHHRLLRFRSRSRLRLHRRLSPLPSIQVQNRRNPPDRPPPTPHPLSPPHTPPLHLPHLLRRGPPLRQFPTQPPNPQIRVHSRRFLHLQQQGLLPSPPLFPLLLRPRVQGLSALLRPLRRQRSPTHPDRRSICQEPKDAAQIELGDPRRLVKSIAGVIESRTNIPVGPIKRPPMFSRMKIGILFGIVLIWAPYISKKVVAGETWIHDYKFLLAGAVFVYFFSVSGAMFNLIRKMPMFIADRNDPGKLVFFYQGSGLQLGAEGFSVGFLFTAVGLVTHGVVNIRNVNVQRTLMVRALIVSFWAVRKVVHLDNWKTGYGVRGYWPTSWR